MAESVVQLPKCHTVLAKIHYTIRQTRSLKCVKNIESGFVSVLICSVFLYEEAPGQNDYFISFIYMFFKDIVKISPTTYRQIIGSLWNNKRRIEGQGLCYKSR